MGGAATSVATPAAEARSGLSLLTTMQWFYGPTWGNTLQICPERAALSRRKPCVKWVNVHARQLELLEVLRRNVLHAAVSDLHLLVAEAPPVEALLSRLRWYEKRKHMLHVVGIAERPSFRTYLAYASRHLVGRTVVFLNQDVYLMPEGRWAELATSGLPARHTYFLSRYHRRTDYDVRRSAEAASSLGLLNLTDAGAPADGGQLQGRRLQGKSRLLQGKGKLFAKPAAWGQRTCDMSGPSYGVWRRTLCSKINFGSYDAYVFSLASPLSEAHLSLFDFPQNAWGGENVLLYIFTRALGYSASNPCLDLAVNHAHCQLPSSFGPRLWGDARQAKGTVTRAVQAKMRAMGLEVDLTPKAVGDLTLNVTGLGTPSSA
mmetsp:Transcript_2528/g.8551  ORF Transcript_2528/g.8551 Transcript_2528/m.8551 type:complete len:375 (-) Transcript_2528:97-1221(-)